MILCSCGHHTPTQASPGAILLKGGALFLAPSIPVPCYSRRMRDPLALLHPATAVEVQRAVRRVRVGGDHTRRNYGNQEVEFTPPVPGTDGFDLGDAPHMPWEKMLVPDHGTPKTARPLVLTDEIPKPAHFASDGSLIIDLTPKARSLADVIAGAGDIDL